MADEYRNVGASTELIRERTTARVINGRAKALVEDGKVLAIIGWELVHGAAYTAFASTEDFFHPRFVRWFRGYLRTLQAELGNLELRAMSYSTHAATPKWFKTLGFDGPRSDGKAQTYVLRTMSYDSSPSQIE